MISSNNVGGTSPHTSTATNSSSNNPLPKKVYRVKTSDEKRAEFKRTYPGFPSRLQEAFRTSDKHLIAERLRCTTTTVTNYLNQTRMPKQDVMKKISLLTGCSTHWLLFGEGSKWVGQETSSSNTSSSSASNEVKSNSTVNPQPTN